MKQDESYTISVTQTIHPILSQGSPMEVRAHLYHSLSLPTANTTHTHTLLQQLKVGLFSQNSFHPVPLSIIALST